ncbi:MAG: hypothetical protein WAL22_08060 [Solirubrobacteraceae bacterium]
MTEGPPAAAGEPPTAQHQAMPRETVELPTQISEPVAAPPAPPTPPAPTRPPIPPPVPPAVETGPQPGPTPIEKVTALVAERPEIGVGGAFAGGIVIALILKRLGR